MQTALKRQSEEIVSRPSDKRTVKMEGNVAYISSNHVRQNKPVVKAEPKTAAKTVAKKAVRTTAKTAAKPRAGVVSTLFVLFIAFGALAVLVSRYAMACSIGAQNNSLKNNIKQVEAKMEELKLDMELRDDLQYVQDTAQNELGMTYPTPDQKFHVDTSS